MSLFDIFQYSFCGSSGTVTKKELFGP